MEAKMKKHLDRVSTEYGDELYFKNFNDRYIKWVNNVEEGSDKIILSELFYNLKFFSKVEIKEILKAKVKALSEENEEFSNTAFLPLTPVDGRHSGSNDMIALIKEIDREEQFQGTRILPYRTSILTDINYAESFDTFLFIDDISGTGGTVEKFVAKNFELMKDKKIIILFLVATEQAIKTFSLLKGRYTSIRFEFDFCYKIDKLSAQKVLSSEQYSRLFTIEENLWGKGNNNILGYRGSELLVLFSHNIPNNTVSSFWYYSDKNPEKWRRLFVRITAPNRQMQNYRNRKNGAE